MDDESIYIPNDDKQNDPSVDRNHWWKVWTLIVWNLTIKNEIMKLFSTSATYSPMSPYQTMNYLYTAVKVIYNDLLMIYALNLFAINMSSFNLFVKNIFFGNNKTFFVILRWLNNNNFIHLFFKSKAFIHFESVRAYILI